MNKKLEGEEELMKIIINGKWRVNIATLEDFIKVLIKQAKLKKHKYPATELKESGYDYENAVNNWDAEASRHLGFIEGYDSAIDEFLSLIKDYSEYGKYKIKDIYTELEVIPIDTINSKLAELSKKQ